MLRVDSPHDSETQLCGRLLGRTIITLVSLIVVQSDFIAFVFIFHCVDLLYYPHAKFLYLQVCANNVVLCSSNKCFSEIVSIAGVSGL